MNEVIETEEIKIENMIYEVRGVQVMHASDVANLYHVETKAIILGDNILNICLNVYN